MSEERVKVRIRDLYFSYQGKEVIHGLSLDIHAQEITAIIGPANSGITTLLRCLNRLYQLNPKTSLQGEILIDGQDIHGKEVDINELRRKVGIVFDVPTSLPLSIYDNVAYGPRVQGEKDKNVLDEIVEKTLKEAVLWEAVKDRLNSPAQSLSGGQQQRLSIARVLALQPQIIMLDRPCSGLDPVSTLQIEESLIKLKEEYTIIIAPHNNQQASRISDRLVFMLMGSLIEEGITEKVFSAPTDKRTNDYITGRFG